MVGGCVLVEGLRKGEARKLHRLLSPLEGIVGRIVSRERSLVLRKFRECLDRLMGQGADGEKAT